MERPPLSAKEVAQLAGLTAETVRKALLNHCLVGQQVGARKDWRIEWADYQDWRDRGAPTQPPKEQSK